MCNRDFSLLLLQTWWAEGLDFQFTYTYWEIRNGLYFDSFCYSFEIRVMVGLLLFIRANTKQCLKNCTASISN